MILYCIYDKLADESGPLFEAKNDTVAIRMYQSVNLPGRPEDYKLLRVGKYTHDPVKVTGEEPVEVYDGTLSVEEEPNDED